MKHLVAFSAALILLIGISNLAFADSRNWSLTDTEGGTFQLSSVKGTNPVLLVFWATWCVPCKKELDQHRPLFDSYQEKGVQVILVSEDNPRSQAQVKPFIKAKGYEWMVLLDPNGEVLKSYGGLNLPYTVLLDKDGTPVERIRGALKDTAGLTAQINKLLGAKGE